MESLIKQIEVLEEKSEALSPSEPDRLDYLSKIQDYANGFINTIDEQVSYDSSAVDVSDLKISSDKKDIKEILKIYEEQVATKGINAASGGHIGYIPGGGIFTSALADFLASITNEYAGMHFGSPGAVSIENELLNWMKGVFSYPKYAIGNLTSGGSIANLIALTSARDKHKIKGQLIEKSVIYMSPQSHHCIDKAIRIIGLEDVIIRHLELDDVHRIDSILLQKQIKQDRKHGFNPFLVIGSAGTTDTGAIDPLEDIGRIAEKEHLWFHIDAAYGGFFILTETKKELFKGIELSDSLVVDPHKGLFLPYGIGAVLIKDKEAVFHSHHHIANYMQDAIEDNSLINPADVSPELTKHFRGLRMWLPLQLHGIEPFTACLEEKLLLTEYFRNKLVEIGFKIGPEPDLSVSYFWYPSKKWDEDAFNQKLMELIHEDGRIFLSSTRINNKFVIRMAVLSFRTKIKTIDKSIQMIEDALALTNAYFFNH